MFGFWTRLPLYLRIVIGLVLGIATGLLFGPATKAFDLPARLILRVLGALAPVVILVAVVRAILTADIHGRLLSASAPAGMDGPSVATTMSSGAAALRLRVG